MDRPTRVGILGCGRIVDLVHMDALAAVQHVTVTALAEQDESRRGAVARRFPDARVFTDYGDLLVEADVDAVVVALPPARHADAVGRALDAGRHVYVEKPLAVTLDDAKTVVERWRASDRVAFMGFNYRYDPTYLKLARLLEGDAFGRVLAVRSAFSSAPRALPAWKRSPRSGGGALLDLASHHADLIPHLFGRTVETVSARVSRRSSDGDTALVNWDLTGGLPVQSFFSLSAADIDRIEVFTEGGVLVADRYRGCLHVNPPEHRYGRWARLRQVPAATVRGLRVALGRPGESSFKRCLAAFVFATRLVESTSTLDPEHPPGPWAFGPPDLECGLRSLAIVDAARRSAEAGGTPCHPGSTD